MTLAKTVAAIALSVVTLSACSALQKPGQDTSTAVPTPTPNIAESNELAEAMKNGQPMNCTITNETRNETITFKTKGQKVRMTGIAASGQNQPGSMINDGEFIYVWSETDNKGFKSKVPDMADMENMNDEMAKSQNGMPDFSDEAVQKQYQEDGYAINCAPGEVADSEFTPPTNVEFQDFSAMMDAAMKAQGAMTPEQKAQMEAMMKQQGAQ